MKDAGASSLAPQLLPNLVLSYPSLRNYVYDMVNLIFWMMVEANKAEHCANAVLPVNSTKSSSIEFVKHYNKAPIVMQLVKYCI